MLMLVWALWFKALGDPRAAVGRNEAGASAAEEGTEVIVLVR